MNWSGLLRIGTVTALTLFAFSTADIARAQTTTFGNQAREYTAGPFEANGTPGTAPPVAPPSTNLRLSPVAPPAPVVDASQSDYSWLLNQVREKRRQAIANLRAQQQATANRDGTSGDQHRKIHELRRNYEDQDSQLQDREQRVNRQLDRLERLLREHEVLNQNASPEVTPQIDPSLQRPTPEATQSPQDQTDPQPSEMITKPIADHSDSVETDTQSSETGDENVDAPSEAISSLSPSQVDAIELTRDPVDRLALANNLYGTGEYSLALKIYSKVDKSGMVPGDKIWIRFQIANCHRQLGNFKESQRGYRVVTSAAADTWVGSTARWWLDATDKSARLKDRIKNLQASYGQLRKEVDEPNAKP